MFIRNAWYVAAWSDELRDQPLARRILNEPVVLFRDRAGRAAALADRCCHRAAPLSHGTIVDAGIQCGYHGLVIDGDGRCVRVPGQTRIPADARVRAYRVVEKNQFVWLWMGDAEAADAAKIVDYPYHDDPGLWPNKHAVYPIKGNYMLMVDNLMDLTHLGYLHAKTVGGNPSAHVEAEMKTTRTPGGLKFERWMCDSLPPPSYVRAAGFKGRIDRWQEFEWVAPSNVLQWTGAKDVGQGAYDGNREGGFQFKVFHGLTPETETSCFYYFATANGWAPDDASASDQFFRDSRETFLEDKNVVEQQQRRLTEFGEDWLVNIVSDGTRMQMRRVLNAMLAAERHGRAAE